MFSNDDFESVFVEIVVARFCSNIHSIEHVVGLAIVGSCLECRLAQSNRDVMSWRLYITHVVTHFIDICLHSLLSVTAETNGGRKERLRFLFERNVFLFEALVKFSTIVNDKKRNNKDAQ